MSLIVGKKPRTERSIDVNFGKLVSNLDADGLDFVFQELLAMVVEDAVVINALHVVVDAVTEGVDVSLRSLMIGPDLPFTIAKLLFELTRSLLLTSSSDIFVGLAKLVVKILRERVPIFYIFSNDSRKRCRNGIWIILLQISQLHARRLVVL